MITIKDIARQAGVSVSTASRALNNNSRISLKTRERIQKLAKDLDYLPNYTAKNLTRGEANVVGVIFPTVESSSPENPFYIDMLRGINQSLVARHYVLSIAIGSRVEEVLANVTAMVQQAKVKRFVLLYTDENDPVVDYLRRENLDFVVIGQPVGDLPDRYVDNDNVQAGRDATMAILQNGGVRNPLFVESEYEWQYEQNRRMGYEKAMAEVQLEPLVFRLPKRVSETAVEVFLNQHQEVDAVIATDDVGLLRFNRVWSKIRHTKKIPMMSFNKSELLALIDQDVRMVDMRPEMLGSRAVELLFTDRNVQKLIVQYEL
ncbi:LacI family DNA-binding transcriptional regulator [Latilactobacillus sakei]|uniref:LacI family DNA-binding transcriptional regulator n=1 Tax=Latilactobacillus sakei TaxID=1599 RepID=UPI000C6F1290|nr:LacI family DNA-binding transcriptional regulator [Latilactobacillus sakei]MCE8502511.1 LacI family DNA-binding transcriptional regulator [Latilactobacillus sakei]MDN4010766.1 LacI family DNA-binding transcriptional regulator [Latilactobacillus sakei]